MYFRKEGRKPWLLAQGPLKELHPGVLPKAKTWQIHLLTGENLN